MVNLALSLGQVLLALFLVALNGFFVGSEFALVRIRPTSVQQLVNANRTGSAALQDALDNLDDYLATTQLGITIASLGLGWVGEPAVAALIEPVLAPLLPESAIHLVAFALGFSVITFLHVVFGELAPKTIAIQHAEGLALFVAPPMRLFYLLFLPGIIIFNGTANAFTRLLGVDPASETDETMQEEELLMILSRSGQEGLIDRDELSMIRRVFDLDDTTAREVMRPRPDVVSVTPDTTMAELQTIVEEEGHTRYPVLDEAGEQVEGFVDVKDLVVTAASDETAGQLQRSLPVVPETLPVDDLLRRFQAEETQLAAVIDEFGAFEGIVTVEDVLEVVVGELRDTFDRADDGASIRSRANGTFRVDGHVTLSRLAERLDVEFDDEESQTAGGLVMDRLGRVADVGDAVDVAGYRFEVTAVEDNRIRTLVISEIDSEDES